MTSPTAAWRFSWSPCPIQSQVASASQKWRKSSCAQLDLCRATSIAEVIAAHAAYVEKVLVDALSTEVDVAFLQELNHEVAQKVLLTGVCTCVAMRRATNLSSFTRVYAAGAKELSAETQLKQHASFFLKLMLRLAAGTDSCVGVAGHLRKGWATTLSKANEDSRSIPCHPQPSDDGAACALFHLRPVG